MKKILVALGLAVLLALPIVGTATASSGPTMAQFKALKARVVSVEARVANTERRIVALEKAPTVACLGTLNVSQYNDFALYDPYDYSWDWTTGLDVTNGSQVPDYVVVTRVC